MTVRQLISLLQKMDPDRVVVIAPFMQDDHISFLTPDFTIENCRYLRRTIDATALSLRLRSLLGLGEVGEVCSDDELAPEQAKKAVALWPTV